MLTKTDLFTTVSPTAANIQQEPAKQDADKPKRAYTKSLHKKRIPSQADRYKINKLLEENLTPKDENGLVYYLNGMSDEKIAKLVSVSRDSVRNMRQEVFGVTRKSYVRSTNRIESDLEVRIAQLEELGDIWNKTRLMIIDHHARIFRLEVAFNKLCEEAGSSLRVGSKEE